MNRIPLLLLPGTLNDARLWQAQSDALADIADIRVADFGTQDSIEAMARDALALAPAERFALAGFSLGGYVAFEVMRQAASRVSGLALVNTSARPEPEEGKPGREKMMALAGRDFPRLAGMLTQFMLPPARQSDEALKAALLAMMDRVGADAYVRQSRAVVARADSRPALASIAGPVLVIGGTDDKVAPPAHSEEIAAAIPQAQLHLLEATGHMGPMERPQEIAALMRGWLAPLN